MKRRNSINEFSFHLTTLPTHYCPSDSGSIYNTTADSEPICYLRPIEQDSCSSRNVPDGVCNINRATPPQSPPPATKRFPSRSLSDSVLVIKEKQKSTIIPSWKPQTSDEKPPYSYATLIAYAILTSPERKLPLSDIYMTIASHFPYYVLGDNGWQNSIRHNLSLNKSFIKLDRKPSDARPGKGSYWTVVEGHEQTFIDSLTRPGGPLRKQTVNVGKRTMASHINSARHQHANCENLLIMGPQDFEKCSKPTHSITTSLNSSEPVSLPISHTQRSHQPAPTSSSMITIFRMAPMVNDGYRPGGKKRDSTSRKRRRTRPEHEHEHEHDSDCDSGVDVGNEFVPSKLFKKKAAAAPHHQAMHHDDDDPTLAQSPYLLDYTVAENISYSPTLSSLLDESSSPAPTSAFSTFPVDCEFEENLLLTQSSSLYSQEDTCWTTDYLTW